MAYLDLFAALDRKKVRYLVVGGVAVNLHGVPRMTAGLDLLPALDRENLLALCEVLSDLGYRTRLPVDPADFADPETRGHWQRKTNRLVFSWYHPYRTWEVVDLLFTGPVTFEDAAPHEVRLDGGGVPIRVAAIADLIRMKSGTGRTKDAADIDALRRRLGLAK